MSARIKTDDTRIGRQRGGTNCVKRKERKRFGNEERLRLERSNDLRRRKERKTETEENKERKKGKKAEPQQ